MIKKSLLTLFLSFVIVGIASMCVYAEVETHDGFYLNFQLGAGYGETNLEEPGDDDFIMDGTTGVFRIKAGYAILNNFVIYGIYGVFNVDEPDYEYGSASGTMNNTTLTYYDYGVGLCYYFMPINIYISADMASSKGRLEINNIKSDTEWGASFTLSVGKEWWVSDNWGLGIAFIISAASMDDSGDSNATISHSFYGLAFTATYN